MTDKLSSREAVFLSALVAAPQTVVFWGHRTLSKFKGYRQDTEQKLWQRELIHITNSRQTRTFRITPAGRDALTIHERNKSDE